MFHFRKNPWTANRTTANHQRIADNIKVYDFELSADDMAVLSKLARPDGRVVNLAFAPKWD